MISNKLKSKFGLFLSGMYLLINFFALIEFIRTPPEPMKEFGFLILTAPWSFILLAILGNSGIISHDNGDSLLFLLVASGAIANAVILYFLGLLLAKLLGLLSTK